MRLIDADDFGNRMYHEAFEKDSDLQKWDSGCWIRYKLFENVLREQPTVQPDHIADSGKKVSISCGQENDLISRQTDCVLKEFGNCSYSETGCADCEVKANIRNALSAHWKCKRMYADVSDTISRQAAIDALDIAIERYDEIAEKYRKKADIERNDYMDMRDNAYEAQQLAQWLNELKYLREKIEQITIKTEPKWIPCSERFPEYNESVLTWDGYVFCIEKRIPYIRDDDGEPIEGDWWVGDEYDEYESECYPNLRDGAAIAWMTLPEPYRGGDSE